MNIPYKTIASKLDINTRMVKRCLNTKWQIGEEILCELKEVTETELDQGVAVEEKVVVSEDHANESLIDKENNVCHSKSMKKRLEVQTGEEWTTKQELEEKENNG